MRLPLRILVLCTGNSARSQMAEALLTALGRDRIVAGSAGSRPAARVNPLALDILAEFGVASPGHAPQGIDAIEAEPWDVVLTVCDNARDACPVFPGATIMAHWGMPDPAQAGGTPDERRAAFAVAFEELRAKIQRLLALPLENLPPGELRAALRQIGSRAP